MVKSFNFSHAKPENLSPSHFIPRLMKSFCKKLIMRASLRVADNENGRFPGRWLYFCNDLPGQGFDHTRHRAAGVFLIEFGQNNDIACHLSCGSSARKEMASPIFL